MVLVKPIKLETVKKEDFAKELLTQFNLINSKSYFPIYEAEKILLNQKRFELWRMKKDNRFTVPAGLVKFTPSSASKCKRELFFKALNVKQDEIQNAPFNNRWTRNSSAVHEAVQRDLFYSSYLLDSPSFTVKMIEKEGFGYIPAWEKNIEKYKVLEHKGVKFIISGMMDGLLKHKKTGKTIGFEFKTKSNNNMQVALLKKPSSSHVQQCATYSLLFDDEEGKPIDDFIITYEAVPKDDWGSNTLAVNDLKTFHVNISNRQKTNILNKFSQVAEMVETGEIPPKEKSKCLFCNYKNTCEKYGE